MKPEPWKILSPRPIYENAWMRLRMALEGEIKDSMSVVGLLLAARRREG
jgi:hypothetical protein